MVLSEHFFPSLTAAFDIPIDLSQEHVLLQQRDERCTQRAKRQRRNQTPLSTIMSNSSFKSPNWHSQILDQQTNRPKELRAKSDHNKIVKSDPAASSRPSRKKEFSAWAEYLDEEKDEDFIKWKKDMLGERQEQQTLGTRTEECDRNKENRPH